MSLRAVRPRGKSIATELPSRAMRSTCGPPGNGSPSTRATLSNASPAASSMVLPSERTSSVTSGTSSRLEWPPDTSIASVGSASGPCSTMSTATWAARWFTPYSGTPSETASAFAAATPTSRAPARPGPEVTAIASRSASRTPASRQARSIVGHHRLEVGPAGHLGHHPAEPGVLLDAAGHGVDQQLLAADDPDTGLVAGGLDAEHQGPVVHQLTSFRSSRMMWASTSPGW